MLEPFSHKPNKTAWASQGEKSRCSFFDSSRLSCNISTTDVGGHLLKNENVFI